MLPDERTTHSTTLALPTDVEALVAAPGRGVAKALVAFLRSQNINVQTATDTDGAFEEALLHPPDIILIDDRILPTGGIDLCQRLKANVRTHFVPVIVFVLNDLRHFRLRATAAGADAVFTPTTDAQERRTRLWALLRTRALFRQMERKQRTQGTEIVDRRRWLNLFLQDLQGSVAALQSDVDFIARFAPPHGDPRRDDFQDSVEDARSLFDLLMLNVRTVADFERNEGGQLVVSESTFTLAEVAREVHRDISRQAALAGRKLALGPASKGTDRFVVADRELVKRAVMNLVLHAVLRGQSAEAITLRTQSVGSGARLTVSMPGEPLRLDWRSMFEPYAPASAASVGYGLGLAMARTIAELHHGRVWVEQEPPSGSALVLQIGDDAVAAVADRGGAGMPSSRAGRE
ncbi:MAG TPA: HAMP domain-containing sensor histidine kinase [Polyangia bacterium]|jgi:signal transduction histidine kinase|nr:HAMP domain-containing sensor histidine kinase [Polyangia bacterium]